MGWFPWRKDEVFYMPGIDQMREPLEAFAGPHDKTIIADVKDLFNSYKLNHIKNENVCIAGGYPTRLAGRTTSYGDIDIWCRGDEAWQELIDNFANGGLPTFAPKGNNIYKNGHPVFHFEYKNIHFDLIRTPLSTDGHELVCITDVINRFDINWCMFAIDLKTDELVIKEEAFTSKLKVNQLIESDRVSLEKTIERIDKYMDRLNFSYPIDETQVTNVKQRISKEISKLIKREMKNRNSLAFNSY